MIISGVSGAGPVLRQSADMPAPGSNVAASTQAGSDPSAAVSAMVSQRVTPPRFPWLSRLAAELSPVAPQRPAFGSAPPLGEHLDQAA